MMNSCFHLVNSLLPRLPLESNSTLVTVKIEKIGLKNASSHIDPYLIVSCKGGNYWFDF